MAKNTLEKILRVKIFGKSPVGGMLRFNQVLWDKTPASLRSLPFVRLYGSLIHAVVRNYVDRTQYFGTFFFRNRPLLELFRRLSYEAEHDSKLNIAVLGCSNGAEVYSILATLRQSRPELKVSLSAVDISSEVLALAEKGSYSLSSPELVGESIFQRIADTELQKIFDRQGDQITIQPWVRSGISWHVGDVRDPEVLRRLGPQDIVVANNFLCHMRRPQAEECLLDIAALVRPGGYLAISGIDLDVRAKTAMSRHWRPVTALLREIHDGDSALRKDWPFRYWGLEPFNPKREGGEYRYASVFQVGGSTKEKSPDSRPDNREDASSSDPKEHSTIGG